MNPSLTTPQIEDLKSYFDDPEEPEDQIPPPVDATDLSPELLLFSAGEFRSKEDLLNILPEKSVMDRLIMRYFSELTSSQRMFLPGLALSVETERPSAYRLC